MRGARRGRHDPARPAELRGHRRCPVFAINFGEIGFLATVERQDAEAGIDARPARATSSCCACPGIVVELDGERRTAINDVAVHRKVGERVAELAYALDGEEAGSVRCDGLVVATPGRVDRLQPRQRRPRDGVGGRRLRGVVHRAPLDDRAGAGRGARRPPVGAQPLARAARRRRRRTPGRRDPAGESRSGRASSATARRSPSFRGRRSTAACATSSGGSRASWPAGARG